MVSVTDTVFEKSSCCLLSVMALLVFLIAGYDSAGVQVKQYQVKHFICDVNVRLAAGCSSLLENARGRIKCNIMCARDVTCRGVSLDSQGRCYHHRKCELLTKCNVKEKEHTFMSAFPPCPLDRSWWKVGVLGCKCKYTGISGKYCENCPFKCNDLPHQNGFDETVLDVYGDGSHMMYAMCKCDKQKGCIPIGLINAGDEDFNKTYTEYRDGFHIDKNHYWIGLKNMYILHTLGQFKSLKTNVALIQRGYAVTTVLSVAMSDENSGYSLTYNGMHVIDKSGRGESLGNCWQGLQGKPFSTWDHDVDNTPGKNCGALSGSGWWFASDCDRPCNMMGWAFSYSNKKPASSIMDLKGINLSKEGNNFGRLVMELSK